MKPTTPTNEAHWAYFQSIAEPALADAPRDYLVKIKTNLTRDGIPIAVRRRDTAAIFDWLVAVSQYQGISDRNAAAFTAKNGLVGWDDIAAALGSSPTCPRLASYWAYSGCSYRKGNHSCAEPQHLDRCTVPDHPTRKGSLIVAAHSLFLFMRDVCQGDFVAWLDSRLASADPGLHDPNRAMMMGSALLEALNGVQGLGSKVWSMALADLLLAGDQKRERWVTTGAGMIVVDSLLHNFLHRTGVLRRFSADHLYGPGCYAPGGCSDLFRGLAQRIDARQFNPTFPASFPRFIQFGIWRLCSTSELRHCNGLSIDDRARCQNDACPAFQLCDRIPLHEAVT
jgi:hypothetical protein